MQIIKHTDDHKELDGILNGVHVTFSLKGLFPECNKIFLLYTSSILEEQFFLKYFRSNKSISLCSVQFLCI